MWIYLPSFKTSSGHFLKNALFVHSNELSAMYKIKRVIGKNLLFVYGRIRAAALFVK
jgi:hypothetical protein